MLFGRDQRKVGKGIPAVILHWNIILFPSVTVWVDCGYNSMTGASLAVTRN